MDARGACPHCGEVLAEWNRRTNRLVVHTWAGFADLNARPERAPVASGEVGRRRSVRTPSAVKRSDVTVGMSEAASPPIELSEWVGTLNAAGSGVDTWAFGEQQQPGETGRMGPVLIRDVRTGALVDLDSVGRAIG
jgi:hypothetical protein